MSGHHTGDFVTTHRADDSDKLVARVRDGLYSSKYKPVDYEKLKALTAEKKFAAHCSGLKVKKLQQAKRQSREQHLLKQHRLVWQKEFLRLNYLRKRQQAETDALVRQYAESSSCPHIFAQFENYEIAITNDFQKFKSDTVDPIWNLREDLQYWLTENNALMNEEKTRTEHVQIQEMVGQVKGQQQRIMEKLYNEQLSLEQDLQSETLLEMLETPEKAVTTGIPEEAFDLECPDPDLKVSVLQEFIFLDEKHQERLNELEDRFQQVTESRTGGWSEENHDVFTYVEEQYPHDMSHRHTLLIDRLRRHFPKMTREELVAHEEWCLQQKHYQNGRRAVLSDWQRDRNELFNKAHAVFTEACVAQEQANALSDHRQRQQEICGQLYQKVHEWRQQKLEILWLEQQMEKRQQEALSKQLQIEEEKQRQKRDKQKEQIHSYHMEKEKEKQAAEERDKRHLEELKRIMEEQAVYDRDRIDFRQTELLKKEEERKEKENKKLEDEAEKERRLEALREQVRPIVEPQPERVWHDTEAWQAHKTGDEDLALQKPLFPINTFTSKQVISDPRVRLENRLRNAGLVNTDYARHALSQMKPLQPPRKDMESSVFKN